MKVVLIPGDGIGKEISQSVKEVNQVLNTDIEFVEYLAGAEYAESHDSLFEDGLLDAIEETGLALKGPTATPVGKGFKSINVQLRQKFDTYANIRPIQSLKGVKTLYEDVDLVIFRENSEDLYLGIEEMTDEDTAKATKLITRSASRRIIREAFEYAKSNSRKKVTCVHKANIMKLTDGMFLEEFRNIANEYPDIENDDCIVDAFCMKAVMNPNQFDVIVTENLYGDIISDLCSGFVGGLGLAPSVNKGDRVRIYEAIHGSAPDIAGKDEANPTALLLSYAMLLEDCGYADKAKQLKDVIYQLIEEKETTKDIGGTLSCSAYSKAIIERLK